MKRDLATARHLLRNDQPLPVDLAVRLMNMGIDLKAFERKYQN